MRKKKRECDFFSFRFLFVSDTLRQFRSALDQVREHEIYTHHYVYVAFSFQNR